MNIGIVCYPTFGGSGIVATELGKQLAILGHQVHFISYQQPVRLDAFYENIFYHEVSVYNYALFENAAPYESSLASRLVDVVLNEKIDILHVHYAIPHATVAFLVKQILLSKGKRIPVVTTLHGTDITLIGKDKSFKPIVEFSINQSDVVTAVSEYLKTETYNNFNITKPIEVIYNFIDCTKSQQSIQEKCSHRTLKKEENIITHVSNFRKIKRIQDIVQGFALVRKKHNCKLLLVGDGPERLNIENLVRELSLQSEIKFLGKQDNINLIYAVSKIFVLASEHESFGLSALEAMACCVPIITTNTGGLTELNIHNKTGFTFSVGDIQKMAEYIEKLLTDEELYQSMSKNAHQQASFFDVTKIIPRYISIYKRLIQE